MYFSFIEEANCVTGKVLFNQPMKGIEFGKTERASVHELLCFISFSFNFGQILYSDSSFGLWTGCYACSHQRKALLCCVAIDGYHSCVVYCSREGKYKCIVAQKGENMKKEKEFCVFG